MKLRLFIAFLLAGCLSFLASAKPEIEKQGSLVISINETPINFPHSQKLNWIEIKEKDDFEEYMDVVNRDTTWASKSQRTPSPNRYALIGDYILITGGVVPPCPDCGFCVVIRKSDLKFIGHFLDENSR